MRSRLVEFISRLRYVFSRTQRERDAERELETHLEFLTDAGMREGLPRHEASRQARLEQIVQDVKYALRSLSRSRGFALVGWPSASARRRRCSASWMQCC